jgi:steroid 5-alpha reductase family enzyme
VQKNEVLATSGPYAYTRNPLYFGSLVLAAGFVIASRNWWVALIAIAIFFLVYFPVIRSEEQFLQSRFPEFPEYARHVPRLLPRIHPYQSSAAACSWHLYWKHREYNAALGSLLMVAALVIKCFCLKR